MIQLLVLLAIAAFGVVSALGAFWITSLTVAALLDAIDRAFHRRAR